MAIQTKSPTSTKSLWSLKAKIPVLMATLKSIATWVLVKPRDGNLRQFPGLRRLWVSPEQPHS